MIAQVHGHAIAGGAGLATVCDFVFIATEAKMGYPEVKIGFVPALVSVFLIRKIGEGRARELLLSGKLYSANKLMDYNAVTEVVESEELSEKVNEFALSLVENNSGDSMRQTIKIVTELPSLPLKTALGKAAELNARSRATSDCKKGIKAFLDKKPLKW